MPTCGCCGAPERRIALKDEDGEAWAVIYYCPHCKIQYDGDIDEEVEN